MSQADVLAYLATLSAAAAALVMLVYSGLWRLSRGLTALCAATAIGDALMLCWPARFWTPEAFLVREACSALLCALTSLELGRGALRPAARVWRTVCRRTALLLVPLAAIGVLGLATLASAPRVGYRGLLVVDAAVTGLLAFVLNAVTLHELPRHPLAITALRGLLRHCVVQVLYLGAWEASAAVATALGWAACGVYAWAMLAITRQAIVESQRPMPSAARVTR